MAEIILIR